MKNVTNKPLTHTELCHLTAKRFLKDIALIEYKCMVMNEEPDVLVYDSYVKEVKETASDLNDKRPKLLSILEAEDYSILLVEHKDKLTRFGFNYLDILLKRLGVTIEVINLTEEK